MKSLFNRSFALITALIFLVSTTGIVLASHRCLANDHQTISLYTNTGCCSEKDNSCKKPVRNAGELSSACCVTEFSFHKIDASSTVPAHSLNAAAFICSPVLPVFILNLPLDNGLQFFTVHHPPLLLAGKMLLISIRCLLF